MSYSQLLLIGYCIFFTVFNLSVTVLYYLYGFFFEKKLREFDQIVSLPEKLMFMFHFKGVYGSERVNASRGGALAQFGAIGYFAVLEITCFLITFFTNDAVLPCRISVLMALIFVLGGIVRFIMTSVKIKKTVKETELLSENLFVEENAVDRDGIEIDKNILPQEESLKEKRMEQALYELWEQENDHENETTNADEGHDAVKDIGNDVIGADYDIALDSAAAKDAGDSSSLDEMQRSEEGVYKPADFEKNLRQEYEPVFVDNEAKGEEAGDIAEGRKYLEKLKNDVIGADYDPIVDDSEMF